MLTIISPRLTLQKYDTFTTGIVYMPFLLAYLGGHLRHLSIDYKIIDCFGENPENWGISSKNVYRGISNSQIERELEAVSKKNKNKNMFIILFASNASYHQDLTNILILSRKLYPDAKILIAENSQAVTAYAISTIKNDFFK